MNNNGKNNKAPAGRPMGGHGGGPPGSQQVEKAKNAKGALIKLVKILSPFRALVFTVLIMVVISTVFTIYSPKVSAEFIDEIVSGLMPPLMTDKRINTDELQKLGDYMDLSDPANLDASKFDSTNPEIQKILKDSGVLDVIDFTSPTLQADMKALMTPAGINFDKITQLCIFLLILYLVSSIFSFFTQFIMAIITQKVVLKLRNDVNAKLSKLPLSFFDNSTKGEMLSIVSNDIDNISMSLQQNMTQLISSVASIIGIVIMMITVNAAMTGISLITIPFCLVVVILIASKSRKYFGKQWKITGDLNGHIEEMYTGHKIVKVFSLEKKSLGSFDKMNDDLFQTSRKAQFISGIIMPLMNMINNIGYIFICVVGGIFAVKKTITIGDIQAMINYSRNLTQQISQSTNIMNTIQSALASAERVFNLLEQPEEIPESNERSLSAKRDTVRFNNVKFSYSEDKPLIKDMNLDVKAGQMIAIVGPTGAGKTTIVNLLMRFYDISSGTIKINGVDIMEIPRSELRSTFGMVLQDTWLFNGTIYDNIAYGRENSTSEEIYAAAKAARADHFIATLPDGYNTILDEDGSNLSQGQRQLLTIARAINAKHDILILDEATSSVDTRTEILIQKAMSALMKDKTSFVIAHRLSTIQNADVILVMNHGDIIEQGTHDELLQKGGFYKDLYYSQFAGSEAV